MSKVGFTKYQKRLFMNLNLFKLGKLVSEYENELDCIIKRTYGLKDLPASDLEEMLDIHSKLNGLIDTVQIYENIEHPIHEELESTEIKMWNKIKSHKLTFEV